MRVVAIIIVAFSMSISLTPIMPIEAKNTPQKKKTEESFVIEGIMTFHNASPKRLTALGELQNATMAALNRDKKHPLMDKRIIPFAYRDKKTGKKIFLKLSRRKIADVMGPSERTEKNYHIDYYLSGPMPDKYEKCNKTTW